MSVLDDMFTKMASLQGHVRVHDCRGMHKSQWAPELGYWVCATCMVALDEKRRGQWATHTWIQRDEVRPVQEESLERGATSRGDADPGGARVREGGAMSDVLGEDRAGDDAGVRGAEGSGQPLKLKRLADWVVKELQIASGRPTLVIGAGGEGKTPVATAMLVALAADKPVWDLFHGASGRVGLLDYELGARATRHRLDRTAAGLGVDLHELGNRLVCECLPAPLTNNVEELVKIIDGLRVVVVDSLRAATPGEDENDSRIAQYLHTLTRASVETNCAIVLLAHQGHQGGRARGSSALHDAAGSTWILDKWQLRQVKVHPEAIGREQDIRIRPEDGAQGVRIIGERSPTSKLGVLPIAKSGDGVGRPDARLRLSRAITAEPGQMVEHIAKAAGVRVAVACQEVNAMIKDGIIVARTIGRGRKLYPCLAGAGDRDGDRGGGGAGR